MRGTLIQSPDDYFQHFSVDCTEDNEGLETVITQLLNVCDRSQKSQVSTKRSGGSRLIYLYVTDYYVACLIACCIKVADLEALGTPPLYAVQSGAHLFADLCHRLRG